MKNMSLSNSAVMTTIFPPFRQRATEYTTHIGETKDVTSSAIIKGDFVNPNPWTYTINDRSKFSGRSCCFYPKAPQRLYWTQEGPHSGSSFSQAPTWDRASVYNAALSKLNEKTRGDLDLAVDIAEAGQTFHMIRNVANLKRFALNGWGPLKAPANGWLEFQYGWKPLCQSIWGAANESARHVLSSIANFRSGRRLPVPTDGVKRLVATGTGAPASYAYLSGKGSFWCTFAIRLDVKDHDWTRFTSLNPVSLGWELIPYSFVVDWFYNVGAFLRDLETALLYRTRFVKGYYTEGIAFDGYETVPEGKLSENYDTSYYVLNALRAHIRYISVQRTVLSSYPLPHLPRFRAKLGSVQMLNAAALLAQFLPGASRKLH